MAVYLESHSNRHPQKTTTKADHVVKLLPGRRRSPSGAARRAVEGKTKHPGLDIFDVTHY